jgi:hypothetical protein
MLQTLDANNLTHWLQLYKDALTSTTEISGTETSCEIDQ